MIDVILMPKWQEIKQRYAAAVLYYATGWLTYWTESHNFLSDHPVCIWNNCQYVIDDDKDEDEDGSCVRNCLELANNGHSIYNVYKDYWDGEEHFAHKHISNIMELIPPFTSASDSQIRNLITGTLKYTTMFTSSISALKLAVAEYKDTNTGSALNYWDTGAMFFVGSMEGQGPNDNQFGGAHAHHRKGIVWRIFDLYRNRRP